MKKISIVSSCFNEEKNLDELYKRVNEQWKKFEDKYIFDYILLDNGSTDNTEEKLRELASKDKRIKVILNSRNFGQNASPLFGVINSDADAVILIASDLQDPPELIPKLIQKWEEGNQLVLLKKKSSEENFIMYNLRKLYYEVLNKLVDNGVELAPNCTGSGLVDKKIIDNLKKIDDPDPYYRGLLCEIGFKRDYVEYNQPTRKRGISCNNFYTLYSLAMLGITKFSKMPLRFMAFTGFIMSAITFLISIFYLLWKLFNWKLFSFGVAPIILSILFLGSVQLFCLGILGEYIGAIYTRVNKKPLVIVKEKINF
ncbi:glycosyltransferase family 2 protein [bacterium]|nr:glycosyltransferase family 2 protein [bacterium]